MTVSWFYPGLVMVYGAGPQGKQPVACKSWFTVRKEQGTVEYAVYLWASKTPNATVARKGLIASEIDLLRIKALCDISEWKRVLFV